MVINLMRCVCRYDNGITDREVTCFRAQFDVCGALENVVGLLRLGMQVAARCLPGREHDFSEAVADGPRLYCPADEFENPFAVRRINFGWSRRSVQGSNLLAHVRTPLSMVYISVTGRWLL